MRAVRQLAVRAHRADGGRGELSKLFAQAHRQRAVRAFAGRPLVPPVPSEQPTPRPKVASTPGLHDAGGASHKIRVVSDAGVGFYLVASELIPAGEAVISADLSVPDGRIKQAKTMYTVQVGVDRHLHNVPDDRGGIMHLLSHMESPSLRVEVTEDLLKFVALRDLQPGEELGFHYASSEWSMSVPFVCSRTGAEVQGFAHLSPASQRRLRDAGLVASHIEALAEAQHDEGYTSSKIEVVVESGLGSLLRTKSPIAAGEKVIAVDLSVEDGRITSVPTMYSVQCGVERHVDNVPLENGGIVRLLSHMEQPTLQVEVTQKFLKFLALRDLQPGEELGFHYATNEWSMAAPFVCSRTGASVQGFAHLSAAEQQRLRVEGLVTSHIGAIVRMLRESQRSLDSLPGKRSPDGPPGEFSAEGVSNLRVSLGRSLNMTPN